MIVVFGATGKVGSRLVEELLASGESVRAVSRSDRHARTEGALDWVQADLADPASLSRAVEGAEAVFFLWPFVSVAETRKHVDDAVAGITASGARVVFLSAEAAGRDSGSFWRIVEETVETATNRWTELRPVGFAANTLAWSSQIRSGDVVRWPFGDARRSLIHEADIAAAARVALLDSAHDGKRYVLTGPAALSQREQVETIGTALGRRLSWVEMPTDEALAMLAPALGDAFADAALREWQRFVSNPEPVNNEVATLTGREPRTFAEWADEHKSQFGGS